MRMNINCDEISQELRVMINLNIKFDEINSFYRGRMDIEWTTTGIYNELC